MRCAPPTRPKRRARRLKPRPTDLPEEPEEEGELLIGPGKDEEKT